MNKRSSALELSPDEFRRAGHQLIDQLADFLSSLPSRPVTRGETVAEVRAAIGSDRPLPETGSDAGSLTRAATDLLADHSLFNGHPRFFGYVTSSAAPIGALADLIVSVMNPNAGAWKLAPAASEIEAQTIRWIAEFVGYPSAGGLLVSGGNMANFVGFLAARAARGGAGVRKEGIGTRRLRCYCSVETHTWIQKSADMSGLGTNSIRWIGCDDQRRIDVAALRRQIELDAEAGDQPFLVVGNAGTVSTGACDPLREMAGVCRERDLWFHVDGAYGGLAAQVPGAPEELQGLTLADSVAVDPHKWLYAPLDAGCVLVRDTADLLRAFSYHPAYYNFEGEAVNYYDLGPENSRSFRALKIWLAFQQAGRSGYLQTIGDDIALARQAFDLFREHPDLEAATVSLSICTLRYFPSALRPSLGEERTESLLNELNTRLLAHIEKSGYAFLSNAVIEGKFLLRLCIVNFRTSAKDIESLPGFIAEAGAAVFSEMQGLSL
jgi:aromatic-L-amino-acid/L-tryptophan decarboxylase